MGEIYSVEVFKSSVSGQEVWINDYETQDLALNFYSECQKREAIRHTQTPSKYYKTNYLGKKSVVNGKDIYENERKFEIYG